MVIKWMDEWENGLLLPLVVWGLSCCMVLSENITAEPAVENYFVKN